MGEGVLAASVLDASALIALERGDRRVRAVLEDRQGPLLIPATVLAQVWRDGARQARLATLISSPDAVVEILDELAARGVGTLLARSGTADIADAHVVLTARRHRALVLTSDAADLRRIDPQLPLEEL